MQEERLALRVDLVHLAQRQRVQILVGHAPHVLAVDGGVLGDVAPIHVAVAVVAEEIVHVVELAVTAVDEVRLVAAIVEDARQREQVLVVVLADQRIARCRRHRQRQRLQPAHRARAVGIEVVEEHAVVDQGIQVGGELLPVAERAQVVAGQALHADQHHVEMLLRADVADRAGEVARVVADEGGVRRLQQFAQSRVGLVVGQGAVELGVVQVRGAERGEELVDAVAGQFVDIGVAGAVLHAAVDGEHRDHREHQPEQHQLAALPQPAAIVARAQAAAADEEDHQRQRHQQRQPAPDRVGLLNVADHLGGVDQIIHRDEIEANAELVPEHQFGSGDEQQPVDQQQTEAVHHPLAGTRGVGERGQRQHEQERQDRRPGHLERGVVDHVQGTHAQHAGERHAERVQQPAQQRRRAAGAGRHQPQQQHHRPRHIDEGHQVVAQPHAERIEQVQRRVRHVAAGHHQQHHAGDEGDRQVGDAQPPQRSEALAQRRRRGEQVGHG